MPFGGDDNYVVLHASPGVCSINTAVAITDITIVIFICMQQQSTTSTQNKNDLIISESTLLLDP